MGERVDLAVIGGGFGGLTAAQYGGRANLNTVIIEEMASGGQALLIADLENYPGFPEPVNGFEISERMERQAKNFGAKVISGTASSVAKIGDVFEIAVGEKVIEAYAVIIATGAKHRRIGVPGEEELGGRGVSYCATCDGPLFRNKRILVVGGGDAACDEAQFLAKITDKVVMIHRRERFRAQKSLAERILGNPNIEVRFNHETVAIKGSSKVEEVVLRKTDTGEEYAESFDAVFVFVGSLPETAAVPQTEKDEGGHIVTDQQMETNVKGLFAVGDVRATPFRQLVVAAGEGAVAAHCAVLHIDEVKGASY